MVVIAMVMVNATEKTEIFVVMVILSLQRIGKEFDCYGDGDCHCKWLEKTVIA